MNGTEEAAKRHVTGDLRVRLHAALRAAGKDPDILMPEDLAEADHLHSGGRSATSIVAKALGIGLGTRLLDLGSGLGGPARYFAQLGAVVTGVDDTDELVSLSRELNEACFMAGSITMLRLHVRNTSLDAASFDAVTMLHGGMNVVGKRNAFTEVHRLLRPGGVFGIYDLMGTNDLTYPMPWSDDPRRSYVESADAYRKHLHAAGFEITQDLDLSELAIRHLGGAKRSHRAPQPLLDTSMLRVSDPEARADNLFSALESAALVPRLLIARRPI